jgi:hypothetical protein
MPVRGKRMGLKRTCLAGLALAIATVCLGTPQPAVAEDIVSQYTSADLDQCRKFDVIQIDEETEHGASWECKGVAGYVVVVTDEDARTTVSVGRSAKAAGQEPAASEGFPSFNSTRDTIEWRSVKGAAKPFAIIQRWSVGERGNSRELLIVTRLPPGKVCQVAHVDAAAKDANLLARQVADRFARHFRCGRDKIRTVGARGRAG